RGSNVMLSDYFVKLPAWFVSGTMTMTWIVYILAYIFKDSRDPLKTADIIGFILAAVIVAAGLIYLDRRDGIRTALRKNNTGIIAKIKEIRIFEAEIMLGVLILATVLMYTSFAVMKDRVYVGFSVFSDFTPHISMIRSFSFMNNFPTQYSVCAGSDVKYHFMFTFLVGNLEYLGLRIDHAFNIPSILGFTGAFSVLYALAVKITGKRLAGVLSMLLFAFRSSFALFYHLASLPDGSRINDLFNGTAFVGITDHEDWGLWNLNVYCNQRHFAFALIVLLIIILLYLEPLYEAGKRMVKADDKNTGANVIIAVRSSLFSREGWLPVNIKQAVFTGILLGIMGFWNGAVLIGTVVVLFFIAAFADRRLEYLILAACAGILSMIQTGFFIDESAFSFSYRYGFLATDTNFFGVLVYILRLFGILMIMLPIAFVTLKSLEKLVLFAFSTPFILSFFVSLTPDIAVNHKYIMISVMLMGIFAAGYITEMFSKKDLWYKLTAVLLVLCLTCTGIYELGVVLRKNKYENAIKFSMQSDITDWIRENCTSKDLFLTSNYFLNGYPVACSLIASGASMYNAWQYFGWSAGYDTVYRDKVVRAAYGAENPLELRDLITQNGLDYAVIDRAVRESDEYEVNERLFDDMFEVVYSEGTGQDLVKIYDLGRSK
nr:hypothetical protein [Lachnospiraceae bacterium]